MAKIDSSEFKIEGLDSLLSKLSDMENLDVTDDLFKGGYILQAESQKNAPVKTGFMRNSAYTESPQTNQVQMVFGAEYSYYVEQDKPFVRPAIESTSDEIVKVVGNGIEEKLKNLKGG